MKKIVFTFMALAASAAAGAKTPEQRAEDFIQNEIFLGFPWNFTDINVDQVQAVCKTCKEHLLSLDTFIYYSDKQHFEESKKFLTALADYYKICIMCQKVGQWEKFFRLSSAHLTREETLIEMISQVYRYDVAELQNSTRARYNIYGEPYYLEPFLHEKLALADLMPALKKCFEENAISVIEQ